MDDTSTFGPESTMQMTGAASESALVLPHLPGFRSSSKFHGKTKRKHLLSSRMGLNFVEDPEEVMPPTRTLLATNSATSLTGFAKPLTASKKTFEAATSTHPVLCFYAYFKEAVHESSLENYRVRKCELMYYTADDTIQITERKQENSGVPQGNFMRRHKVPKDDDSFFTLDDLEIDSFITIYRRTFHIVGANSSTLKFLHATREHVPEMVDFPMDRYENERAAKMSRETGKDMHVSHGIKKNPMKAFAEAMLGKTVDNSGREGFLKYDRMVLRFTCLWDDRANLYGDLQQFKVHYFLTDDSIEVLAVYTPNCGRDPYPLLLKRAKLPKDATDERVGFYHWSDLAIGGVMHVFSRKLVLVDADEKTREFYDEQNMPLAPALLPEPEPPVTIRREVPPHTGFGSEEDSMTSCVGSLVPTAPKKTRGENRTLRYLARLVSSQPEDEGREFVIQFFLVDQTLSIREPPKRNSGIVGGNFLRRGLNQVRDDHDIPLSQGHFYIGARISVGGHTFIITDSDDATMKHMERVSLSSHGQVFPHSNYMMIMLNFGAHIQAGGRSFEEFRSTCTSLCGGETQPMSFAHLKEAFSRFSTASVFPEQAVITVFRKVSNDEGNIDVDFLMQEMANPTNDETYDI